MKLPFSWNFVHMMHNRIHVSHYKYEDDLAKAKNNPSVERNELKNAEYRIKLYKDTGNPEYLIDAANFLMLEFMEMHGAFRPTDDDKRSKIV